MVGRQEFIKQLIKELYGWMGLMLGGDQMLLIKMPVRSCVQGKTAVRTALGCSHMDAESEQQDQHQRSSCLQALRRGQEFLSTAVSEFTVRRAAILTPRGKFRTEDVLNLPLQLCQHPVISPNTPSLTPTPAGFNKLFSPFYTHQSKHSGVSVRSASRFLPQHLQPFPL